jgi:hypothetical protein
MEVPRSEVGDLGDSNWNASSGAIELRKISLRV